MVIEGKEFFERFSKGITFQQWLTELEETTRDKVSRYFDKIYMMVVSEFKEKITCDYNVNILALVDNHCWDCQFYIPVLQRLSENTPNIELRLLNTKDSGDIHLTVNGGKKSPYVMFYSQDGYLVDTWVERPTIVYQLYANLRKTIGFDDSRKDEFLHEYRKAFLKDQETFYRAAAEELFQKICRVSAIQGTSKRINTSLLSTTH